MNDTNPRDDSRWSASILAGALLVAVLLILFTHRLTAARAEAARAERQADALASVLADTPHDNAPARDTLRLDDEPADDTRRRAVHRVRLGDRAMAAVLDIVAHDGYSGAIELLVGISVQGEVIAVRVTEHRETPGLGDRIEHRRSDWITQFDGLSAHALTLDDAGIDALTGATITSRAVVTSVLDALIWFDANREQLFESIDAQGTRGPEAS